MAWIRPCDIFTVLERHHQGKAPGDSSLAMKVSFSPALQKSYHVAIVF